MGETERQYKFLKSAIVKRSGIQDDPLIFAINLVESARTKAGQYIIGILEGGNHFNVGKNELRNTVTNSTGQN